MLGFARPARIAANSSRVTSTALSIFWSASRSVWLIVTASPRWWSGVSADQRPDLLTLHDLEDVALGLHPEHDHRQLVLPAQGEGGLVHDPQALADGLVVRHPVELDRGGVLARVGGVDPVDAVLGHQDHLAPALQRALGGDGVGGEVRQSHAGPEDHDATLLEV